MAVSVGAARVQAEAQVEQMTLRLKALESILANHADAEAVTHKVHLLVLATHRLADATARKQPLADTVCTYT